MTNRKRRLEIKERRDRLLLEHKNETLPTRRVFALISNIHRAFSHADQEKLTKLLMKAVASGTVTIAIIYFS